MVLQDAKADREVKVYLLGACGGNRVFLKKQKLLMATSRDSPTSENHLKLKLTALELN